jgi:hypothetical protein
MTSTDSIVLVDRAPCDGSTSLATARGTTLEEAAPPENQANGGGFNSSLSAGTVTLATPLANGASIDIQWTMGVQKTGTFRFYIVVEALP